MFAGDDPDAEMRTFAATAAGALGGAIAARMVGGVLRKIFNFGKRIGTRRPIAEVKPPKKKKTWPKISPSGPSAMLKGRLDTKITYDSQYASYMSDGKWHERVITMEEIGGKLFLSYFDFTGYQKIPLSHLTECTDMPETDKSHRIVRLQFHGVTAKDDFRIYIAAPHMPSKGSPTLQEWFDVLSVIASPFTKKEAEACEVLMSNDMEALEKLYKEYMEIFDKEKINPEKTSSGNNLCDIVMWVVFQEIDDLVKVRCKKERKLYTLDKGAWTRVMKPGISMFSDLPVESAKDGFMSKDGTKYVSWLELKVAKTQHLNLVFQEKYNIDSAQFVVPEKK